MNVNDSVVIQLFEQAARGLTLMTLVKDKNKDIASWQDYSDLSKQFSEDIL